MMMPVAHRFGYVPDHQVAENCLSAAKLALSMNIPALEFDVQLTKDQVPVVFHDPRLERMTDHDGVLSEYTYHQLKMVSIRLTREPIPTLDQVLALINNQCHLFVELKSGNDNIVPIVCQVLSGKKNCTILSFEHSYVWQARDLGYKICPLLAREDISLLPNILNEKPDYVGIDSSVCTKNLIEMIVSQAVKVNAWTVNEPEEIEKLAQYGVNSITSDRLDLLSTYIFKN